MLGSCDEEVCQTQSISSIDIVYFFPLWFLKRVIYIIAEWSHTGSPTFGLTVQRVLLFTNPETNVLKMIRTKNNQGVRNAIEARYISPNDHFGGDNFTALSVSNPNRRLSDDVLIH